MIQPKTTFFAHLRDLLLRLGYHSKIQTIDLTQAYTLTTSPGLTSCRYHPFCFLLHEQSGEVLCYN